MPDDEMRESITSGKNIYERENPLPAGCQDFAASIGSLLKRGIITEESARQELAEL
jgi:hypothetical protein